MQFHIEQNCQYPGTFADKCPKLNLEMATNK